MNIIPNTTNGTNSSGIKSTPSGSPQNTQTAQSSSKSSPDNVSLSSRAKELAVLASAVENSPEVDEAHVSAIKTAVDEGTYSVDTDKLARNMLNHDDFMP